MAEDWLAQPEDHDYFLSTWIGLKSVRSGPCLFMLQLDSIRLFEPGGEAYDCLGDDSDYFYHTWIGEQTA